jgi:type II secretory pathway pseudopilin PulG
MTLLELVIVLTILAALGGVVLVKMGDTDNDRATITRTTLLEVRKACDQYFADTNRWPQYTGDLFLLPPGQNPYEPATRAGWNGPYLISTGARYQAVDWSTEADVASFPDSYRRSTAPAPPDSAVLDAWGCPIVLQQSLPIAPDTRPPLEIRLVSAGRNRSLETADDAPGSDRGDDLAVFLQATDPLVISP